MRDEVGLAMFGSKFLASVGLHQQLMGAVGRAGAVALADRADVKS